MAKFEESVGLADRWVKQLHSYSTECNASVLDNVRSARSCYLAPRDIPEKALVGKLKLFVPFREVVDSTLVPARYPKRPGDSYVVRMGCNIRSEADSISQLANWAALEIRNAMRLQEQLENLNRDLFTTEELERLTRPFRQLRLNAMAMAHEAIYRNNAAFILSVRLRPGYRTKKIGYYKRNLERISKLLRQIEGSRDN